jgi:aspartate/methionine/tyrosine aminotransferase
MTANPDPIFSIVDRANELRAAGVNVISLAAGEPGAATAPHIVAAAENALLRHRQPSLWFGIRPAAASRGDR